MVVQSLCLDPAGKEQVIAAVQSVEPQGQADLSEALQGIGAVLTTRARSNAAASEPAAVVRSLVVVSDSRPALGVTDSNLILQQFRHGLDAAQGQGQGRQRFSPGPQGQGPRPFQGLTVMTVGIGHDHPSSLLCDMAAKSSGGGHFYFVPDHRDIASVHTTLDACIMTLLTIVAKVSLPPPHAHQSHPGLEMSGCYSGCGSYLRSAAARGPLGGQPHPLGRQERHRAAGSRASHSRGPDRLTLLRGIMHGR